jgi:hypothetical protein
MSIPGIGPPAVLLTRGRSRRFEDSLSSMPIVHMPKLNGLFLHSFLSIVSEKTRGKGRVTAYPAPEECGRRSVGFAGGQNANTLAHAA